MTRRTRDAHSPKNAWSLFLKPGLGVKRWFLTAVAGIMLTSLGLAILLYLLLAEGPLHWFTLSFLPGWVRGVLFLGTGAGLAIAGAVRLRGIVFYAVWPTLSTPERQQAMYAEHARHAGIEPHQPAPASSPDRTGPQDHA